ncbi:FAD-dependent oxidoreductase [Streptomyces virginiae]|uniref:FAD-dependent oxidoreductase n=1 Tax=Streptomyces virginiae TaxID=1961 RepID=UPI002257CA47|nr:FAD-dependent oxidoreductase [Streptomyces virginiae]MCX4961155.1 FAD-dependent oxidoreductase [Streptomyces virginiae]
MLRVAVVGSGPSGVYAAQTLVQQREVPGVRVDVLDRLPAPYGLVRYGVAPDHEKIKSLQGSLRTVLEDERIRFLGNVEVGGEALPTDRLLELYHAVVYCVGAARDRMLGIPGEELTGVHSATSFVSWYSGHPDAAAEAFDLPGVDAAVVVGAGNVAVDVTRILARGTTELAPTDMPQPALDALAESRVRAVSMVARRGPSQGRFTTKELRELGTLPGVGVRADPAELALDPVYADPVAAAALPAVARRNLEVLRGWAEAEPGGLPRSIALRFYLRPVEILGGPDGRVTGMRFERTAPDGRGGVTGTGVHEDVAAQLVLRSVGYKGVPLAGLPFDPAKGTVPHAAGRVLRAGRASVGEYVAGWIKRGPTGVIGTNRPCAKETVSALLQDAGALVRRDLPGDPLDALRAAGLRPVRWPGWLAIEAAEADLGRSLGRRSVKIPDWPGLLGAADPG